LKKDCITQKRGYRNYPIFTKDEIEGIKKAVEREARGLIGCP